MDAIEHTKNKHLLKLPNQSNLLDQLMGASRNEKDGRHFSWKDPSVCKAFLVGLCPGTLFHRTVFEKRAGGECKLVHSEMQRDNFRKSPKYDKYARQYAESILPLFYRIIDICDRKVEREKRRQYFLSRAQITQEQQNQAEKLKAEIANFQVLAEASGEKGDYVQSQKYLTKCANLQIQVDNILIPWTKKYMGNTEEYLCEKCAQAIQVTQMVPNRNDPSRKRVIMRVDDPEQHHNGGRHHMAFEAMREFVAKWEVILQEHYGSEQWIEKQSKLMPERGFAEHKLTQNTDVRKLYEIEWRDAEKGTLHLPDLQRQGISGLIKDPKPPVLSSTEVVASVKKRDRDETDVEREIAEKLLDEDRKRLKSLSNTELSLSSAGGINDQDETLEI